MEIYLGTDSEAFEPLARSIFGCFLVSLVVTVYLVPAAYLWIHRNEDEETGGFESTSNSEVQA
jgi:Cu/Ag efflux pump CusA